MKNQFKIIDDKVEYKNTALSVFISIFKIGEIASIATEVFRDKGLEELNNKLVSLGKGRLSYPRDSYEWFHDGVKCEILTGAKNWQTGKIRMRVVLEFCPDEPDIEETLLEKNQERSNQEESSLDDIRQAIKKDNQY